jgi:hypothetical protein
MGGRFFLRTTGLRPSCDLVAGETPFRVASELEIFSKRLDEAPIPLRPFSTNPLATPGTPYAAPDMNFDVSRWELQEPVGSPGARTFFTDTANATMNLPDYVVLARTSVRRRARASRPAR